MAHSYSSEYPLEVVVDEGIKAFFEEFYKTSDTPDAHDKYADSFTGDATLIMASKKAVGREGKFYLFAFVARFCSIFRPDTQRLRDMWPSGSSSKSLGLALGIALIFDLQRFWPLEKACGQLLLHGKINSILTLGWNAKSRKLVFIPHLRSSLLDQTRMSLCFMALLPIL
jgi:hypothetical protein